MDKRWLYRLYYFVALLWSAFCVYGLFDIALAADAPTRYELSRGQLISGFVLVGALAWLPLFFQVMRRARPERPSIQQSFERMSAEFHAWAQEEERTHRRSKQRDDD